MEKLKEEVITINFEQLEELLGDEGYAKEWKAKRFTEMLKENIKLRKENEELKRIVKVYKESEGYWSKEYMKVKEKAELYRYKYLKWKKEDKRNKRREERKM